MGKVYKKLGLGSLSLLLCIMGILFGFSFRNNWCLGDIILKFVGVNIGSVGLHATTLSYSLIFFIPSIILGFKFKANLGATLGKIVSLIMIILILLLNPTHSISS